MLVRSLIELSSKLLVTRTGIKARTSLISGRIRLLTLELLALEWRNFYTFELKYPWSQLASLDQILCVASLGVGKGCIMFWGRLDQNPGVHGNGKPQLTYNGENGVSTFSRLLLIQSFLYLQVTRTCIKSGNEFEFLPDRTTDYGVSCPWASKNFPIDLQWENGVSMLACSFLIELSSKLLVTRSGIKAWSSSILGQIRPLILELLALEWQNFHTFELEYLWSQLVNLDQILCVASLGWGKGCIRFWGRLTWHIALRWAIVALWATCFFKFSTLRNYGMDFRFSRNIGNMMGRCIWDEL